MKNDKMALKFLFPSSESDAVHRALGVTEYRTGQEIFELKSMAARMMGALLPLPYCRSLSVLLW
jgi:hypothetical protein